MVKKYARFICRWMHSRGAVAHTYVDTDIFGYIDREKTRLHGGNRGFKYPASDSALWGHSGRARRGSRKAGLDKSVVCAGSTVPAARFDRPCGLFWEGIFPAAMHTYIEHICAAGLTFKYGEDGSQLGLCKAKHAVFFGTKGGIYSQGAAREDDFAARFLKTNLRMLGIPELDVVEAEGLDIDGADVEGILEQAKNQARAVAERL